MKRLVVVGAVLVIAIVVGVVFGWLAGVAVVLAAIALPLLAFGPALGLAEDERILRNWGRRLYGPEGDERER